MVTLISEKSVQGRANEQGEKIGLSHLLDGIVCVAERGIDPKRPLGRFADSPDTNVRLLHKTRG